MSVVEARNGQETYEEAFRLWLHVQEYLSCATVNSINSPVYFWELTFQQRPTHLTNFIVILLPPRMTAHQAYQI